MARARSTVHHKAETESEGKPPKEIAVWGSIWQHCMIKGCGAAKTAKCIKCIFNSDAGLSPKDQKCTRK